MDAIAPNTGQRGMQAARHTVLGLAPPTDTAKAGHVGDHIDPSDPGGSGRIAAAGRRDGVGRSRAAAPVGVAGMQQFRVTDAIRAYQDGHVEVRAAAERVRLPVAVFLEKLAARKVAVLEAAEAFGPGLAALRGVFGACP